jgi:peptidyl-tRNA hydrolase
MAVLTTGNTFADGDQVTSTKLNNIANAATFASGAVDDSTTQLSSGAIIVKDLGISTGKIAASAVTTAKINASAVTTAKIADSNVTKAKIENFTNLTVLGNVSGGAATPAEVTIIDDDTMGTASATALATSESIKAYVDTQIGDNNDLSEVLANGNTTGANNIIVTAGQSIGIGTTSPEAELEV